MLGSEPSGALSSFWPSSTAAPPLLLGVGILALSTTALFGAVNPGWIPPSIGARLGDIPAYLGFVDVLSIEVNDENFAIVERIAHWFAALRMWDSSPWLGIGPGNYACCLCISRLAAVERTTGSRPQHIISMSWAKLAYWALAHFCLCGHR